MKIGFEMSNTVLKKRKYEYEDEDDAYLRRKQEAEQRR